MEVEAEEVKDESEEYPERDAPPKTNWLGACETRDTVTLETRSMSHNPIFF